MKIAIARTCESSKTPFIFCVLAWLFVSVFSTLGIAQITLGDATFTAQDSGTELAQKIAALQKAGGTCARVQLVDTDYFPGGTAIVSSRAKAVVNTLVANNITVYILCDYYQYQYGWTEPITYYDWNSIGQALASAFGTSVAYYSAFNEPDVAPYQTQQYPNSVINPTAYATALGQFAAGIHSIVPSAKVIPGGYGVPSSRHDFSCQGYPQALNNAGLFASGALAGIDLHFYWDNDTYTPLADWIDYSANSIFKNVKSTCGLTTDPDFFCTEFNQNLISPSGPTLTEDEAAQRLLPFAWSLLACTKDDGSTPNTKLAFVYSLTQNQGDDTNVFTQLYPWTPTARGVTLQMLMQLTAGMHFLPGTISSGGCAAPWGTAANFFGGCTLSGPSGTLWVINNISGWVPTPTGTYTISGIPSTATQLLRYNYTGCTGTITLQPGETSHQFTDIASGETTMIEAVPGPVSSQAMQLQLQDYAQGVQTGFDQWSINGGGLYQFTDALTLNGVNHTLALQATATPAYIAGGIGYGPTVAGPFDTFYETYISTSAADLRFNVGSLRPNTAYAVTVQSFQQFGGSSGTGYVRTFSSLTDPTIGSYVGSFTMVEGSGTAGNYPTSLTPGANGNGYYTFTATTDGSGNLTFGLSKYNSSGTLTSAPIVTNGFEISPQILQVQLQDYAQGLQAGFDRESINGGGLYQYTSNQSYNGLNYTLAVQATATPAYIAGGIGYGPTVAGPFDTFYETYLTTGAADLRFNVGGLSPYTNYSVTFQSFQQFGGSSGIGYVRTFSSLTDPTIGSYVGSYTMVEGTGTAGNYPASLSPGVNGNGYYTFTGTTDGSGNLTFGLSKYDSAGTLTSAPILINGFEIQLASPP